MATVPLVDASLPRRPAPVAVARPGALAARLQSVDIVRGAVMVFMAIDHVRLFLTNADFSPTDLNRTTVAYFFTRWITHLCAPAFVFLAGTGAFLYGERHPAGVSRFLLTRGIWLIAIEMTIVRLGWTFNVDYANYVLGGVIWMIGWCMILLAGLVHLPLGAVAAFGIVMIAGHNVLDYVIAGRAQELRGSSLGWLWQILYLGGGVPLGVGGPRLAVLFSIVPWVGVMAAGYAFGAVLRQPPERRRRLCYAIGFGAIAAFAVLRVWNLYGDPRPWTPQRSGVFSLLAILNTNKYPASLLFLLMTLGPTIAALPLLERAKGALADALAVFGRVPFFFYILHIPLAHLAAVALSYWRYGEAVPWLFLNHPMGVNEPPPPGWGVSLFAVYVAIALVVFILYFPCRWFADVKARRREWWLGYL
jgi:uncharacterized membrane protein